MDKLVRQLACEIEMIGKTAFVASVRAQTWQVERT
jgi:hypothetical protein